MTRLRFAALAGLSLLAPSTLAAQQRTPGWSGFSAFFENDSFTKFVNGSDDGFTNGVRIQVARDPNAADLWFDDAFDPVSRWMMDFFPVDDVYGTTSFVVGQNFFTPRVITVYDADPTDRPYAGLAFIGIRSETTEVASQDFATLHGKPNPAVRCRTEGASECAKRFQSQTQTVLEVSVGVLGQGAGSRILQAGAHVSPSSSRVPKGWHNQIRNLPHLSTYWQVRQRWARPLFSRVDVDFTPDGVLMLGTSQTYVGAGATARIGWNMTGFPTQAGINNAAEEDLERAHFEAGLSAGVTGRLYGHNAFVQGLRDSDPGVDAHRAVGDYRLGWFVRAVDWRLDWFYAIRRSPEVDEPGPSEDLYDSYGSIQLSHDPGGVESLFGKLGRSGAGKVLRGGYLEVGFGSESDRAGITDVDRVVRTTAFHLAGGLRFPLGFDLGYELTGVGREFQNDERPDGEHSSRYLNHHDLVVGWTPPLPILDSGFGQLRVRAGRLASANEFEITPNAPGPRVGPCPAGTGRRPEDVDLAAGSVRHCASQEDGSGWLFGVGYTVNLGHDAGLHVEKSWHQLGLDERFDFSALTVGLRWAPDFGG